MDAITFSRCKKQRPDHVTALDIECNGHADKLADEAAQQAGLGIPRPIAINIIYYASLVTRIQKRLATIVMHLPAREHNDAKPVSQVVKPPKIADVVAASEHSVSFASNRYFCSVCKNNFRVGDPGLRSWLSSSCLDLSLIHI